VDTCNHKDRDFVIALQDVEPWTGRILDSARQREVDSQVKACRGGDVIFGKLRPYLAKVALVPDGSSAVGEFLVLRPREGTEPAFLCYALRSAPFIHRVMSLSVGAKMPRTEWSQFGTLGIGLPSIAEQRLITRFLDNAELRIGRAIESKQGLLRLLTERRHFVSEQMVLRGLNPECAVLPGPFEWLREVPAHWNIRRAKYFFREIDERSALGEEELLSVSHLTGVSPRSGKNITMFMAESYAGHKMCREGDVVINTMWAWMGALGMARQTGIVSPSYGVYRPLQLSELDTLYADHLLRSRPYIDEYTCRSTGIRASRLRLYPDKFLSIPIICPPLEEQREIVAKVTEATSSIDAALTTTAHQLELLKEYRKTLVADVVTGRRDVRAEAAGLPDVDSKELASVLAASTGENEGGDEDVEELRDAV
jgi:type I restriction enzyme S subunit